MNRRPRKRTASPRLSRREAACDVLGMLVGLDQRILRRDGPSALDASEVDAFWCAAGDLLGLGDGALLNALAVLALDVPSLPGDSVEWRAGMRSRTVIRGSVDGDNLSEFAIDAPGVAPPRRTRPSYRGARRVLRGLIEAVERANPSADAFKCVALVVMLRGLDGHPAFGDIGKAPRRRARVTWLARRIEDLTRARSQSRSQSRAP